MPEQTPEGRPRFTPGPWEYDDGEGYSYGRVLGGHGTIAQVVGDSAETEANGRLMAASPDLYFTLAKTLDWLATYQGGTAGAMYDEVRAVLAAARGEQP